MRIAIGLEYCGRTFTGWQSQADGRGVQDALERALAVIAGTEVRTIAAGRTDAGCHARGQVASLTTGASLPAAALPPVLNRRLPDDVRLRSASEAADGFDARRSAVARSRSWRRAISSPTTS